MKFILGGLVLLVLVCAVTYYGSIKHFNPDEDGRKARESIKNGMTWEQVIQATTTPLKYRVMMPDPKNKDVLETGYEQKFEINAFKTMVAKGAASHGFLFEYLYSSKEHFSVYFDKNGKVESVDIIPGMADLLQQR